MKHKYHLDFFLFDGEGGGEGSGATASSSDSKQDIQAVQYGKSAGEGQTQSQVGTDSRQSVEAEFSALIGKGGIYHDIYGQKVSAAIQDRFKNQADFQGQVSQYNDALAPLFMNYGLKSGDIEGLGKAIADDEAFYKAGAEKAGLSVDQYKENLRLQADSDRLHQIEQSYQEEQRRQQLFSQWESDAAELQQAFPAFDLGMEIESNEKFAQLLNNGVDVKTAFQVAHFDELNNGMTAYHQRTATQQVVNSIQSRQARPMEGALSHAPAIERKSDPSRLTDADLDEINRRVAEGESISF